MRYILKKAGVLIVTLLIISALAFVAFEIIPADPVDTILGTDYTEERAAALRAEGALKRGDAGDDLGAGIHIIKLVSAQRLADRVTPKLLVIAVNDDIRAGNSTGGEGVDEIGEIGEIHFYTP